MEAVNMWKSLEYLKKVPVMNIGNSKIEDAISYYDGKYNGAIVRETETEDFYSYVEELERETFQKCFQEATSNGFVYVAVFRKENLLVNVLYIKPQRTIYIYVTADRRDYPVNLKELFRDVPIHGKPIDHGAGNYVITKEFVEKEQYDQYITEFEKVGFEIYYDDKDGIDGFVYNTTLKKDNRVVTVVYAKNTKTLTVSAGFNLPLSKYLYHDKTTISNCDINEKSKLHMLELYHFGNCFILQLKNGKFVLFDAGSNVGFEYLFDYLDRLCPKGEKPVIEGWFISHAHGDHIGALRALITNPDFGKRIYVEGVYYNEPNDAIVAMDSLAGADITWLKESMQYLTTTEGEHPLIYRPQTGQKYYFHDVEIDIVLAQEQLPIEQYSGEFNDSSTWCMLRVEGQKCLLGGDGDKGGMLFMMMTYDRSFLEVEVASLLHHGWNTRDLFTEFCVPKTMLVTTHSDLPKLRCKENERLKMLVEEWLPWGDGTKVLTFPYQVGEYEKLSNFEWIYHKGKERPSMHY